MGCPKKQNEGKLEACHARLYYTEECVIYLDEPHLRRYSNNTRYGKQKMSFARFLKQEETRHKFMPVQYGVELCFVYSANSHLSLFKVQIQKPQKLQDPLFSSWFRHASVIHHKVGVDLKKKYVKVNIDI